MWGKCRAACALFAALSLSAAVASANPGHVHVKPGTVFVGAPRGFGSAQMHWRVTASGKGMRLVGWFAWNYGCLRRNNPEYGIGDGASLAHLFGVKITVFPAPAVRIDGSSFSGSEQLLAHGHMYDRFTIRGTFTNARTAKALFTFATPPRCGTFTEHLTLQAS